MEADSRQVRGSWEYTSVLSPTRTRCDSPLSGVQCDGWCRYGLLPHATVVSAVCCDGDNVNDIPSLKSGVVVRMR